MGRKSSEEESSESSEESSSDDEKKEKKFDDPDEGGSILPCVVVIVVLAIIGGAIYAIIKHIGPLDESEDPENGPSTDRPKPVLEEEDVLPIPTNRSGGSWRVPSQTHPTPAPKLPYKFRNYPSGACVPVGVDPRTEKTYEWVDDILDYCYPAMKPSFQYNRASNRANGVYFIKSDDSHMKGAAFGCSYNFVFAIYVNDIGLVGNFTYDDAKAKCLQYFGGYLAMFETPYELCQVFYWLKESTSDEYWGPNGPGSSNGHFHAHIKKVGSIWVAGEEWHRTTDGRAIFKGSHLPLTGPFKFIQNQDQSKIGALHRAGLDLKRRAFIAAPKNEGKMFLCKTCRNVNCSNICQHHLYPDYCNNGRDVKEWWML